jgi:hypothetical protein
MDINYLVWHLDTPQVSPYPSASSLVLGPSRFSCRFHSSITMEALPPFQAPVLDL